MLDHVSPHGPNVTHIRGIAIRALAPELHEPMRFVIAASRVQIELGRAHYEARDRMRLGDRTTEELGAQVATSMGRALFSALLRATRDAGLESLWTALRQNDRVWDRMRLGGGVTVIKTGPKDLMLENHGISLVESRHFRAACRAYWLSLGRLFAKAVYVKIVARREPHPHRIAPAGSCV